MTVASESGPLGHVSVYLVLLESAPGLIQLVLQLPCDFSVVAVVLFSQIPLLLRLLTAQNGGWSIVTVQRADSSVHIGTASRFQLSDFSAWRGLTTRSLKFSISPRSAGTSSQWSRVSFTV